MWYPSPSQRETEGVPQGDFVPVPEDPDAGQNGEQSRSSLPSTKPDYPKVATATTGPGSEYWLP